MRVPLPALRNQLTADAEEDPNTQWSEGYVAQEGRFRLSREDEGVTEQHQE